MKIEIVKDKEPIEICPRCRFFDCMEYNCGLGWEALTKENIHKIKYLRVLNI